MSRFSYNDILNLPYPNEEIERDFPDKVLYAAQFAPFSALTGHEEQVEEAARFTERQTILDESEIQQLNQKLCFLKENLYKKPKVSVVYFVKDAKKDGGSRRNKTGILTKISSQEQVILFSDGTEIPMQYITAINSTLFDKNFMNSTFS